MLNQSQWQKVPISWNAMKQGKLPFKMEQVVMKLKALYKDNAKRTVSVEPYTLLTTPGSYNGFVVNTTQTDSLDKNTRMKGTYTEVVTAAQKIWEKMKKDGWSETVQKEVRNFYVRGTKYSYSDIKTVSLSNFDKDFKIILEFKNKETKELDYDDLFERNEDYKLILMDLYSIASGKHLSVNNPIRLAKT